MTTSVRKETIIELNKEQDQDFLLILVPSIKQKFQRILKSYALFNALFAILILSEWLYLLFHFTFLTQSFILAIYFALIVATLFSYATLRLFFQTKKMENCLSLKEEFIYLSRTALQYEPGNFEHHLALANACCHLANQFHGLEYHLYVPPSFLEQLASSFEKVSCWIHWKDVHFMKEKLLESCIEEHIKMVHLQPTHMEIHASLANAYIMLSGLYADPRTIEGLEESRWFPPTKYKEESALIFRKIAERAIEEFKILKEYAPNDPWVHTQLAYSYRDLKMHKEEIQEYETLLQLCPNDTEILFSLGRLYFEHGHNAKGLHIYEILKKTHPKKAEVLIRYYGNYHYS